MADTCPVCRAAVPPRAATCPSCGARLVHEDALVQDLEDLKAHADAALADELASLSKAAEAEVGAVDRTLAELSAVESTLDLVRERLRWEAADLTSFVRRVEARVPSRLRGPTAPPPRSPAAAPVLAIGCLALATGVFLLPLSGPFGTLVVLGGLALLAIGAALYRTRTAGV